MAQENKELLLKDLLGRVLYGVKVDYHTNIFTLGYNLYLNNGDVAFENHPMLYFLENIESVKPYLRPMSSMTDEEREELSDYLCEKVMSNKIGITIPPNPTQGKGIPFIWMGDCMEWLNEHHFDYRGLIEKGLALEAPEGMYKN